MVDYRLLGASNFFQRIIPKIESFGNPKSRLMSLRIKAVVEKFVKELKEALEADIQDRIMKEREMQSYIEEREREVAEREAAWKAELARRESEIAKQEARLKIERENLEKEKSVLMGTASDNQDGALEITVSGEKYRCLRFSKAKK